MTEYNYSVANDTLQGFVYLTKLDRQIRESKVLFAKFVSSEVDGDDLTITTSSALTSGEEDILDDKIGSHDGMPGFEFVSTALLVGKTPMDVDSDWEDVGFVVTTPGAFLSAGNEGAGKAVMAVKTNGSGCQVRGGYRDANGSNFTQLCIGNVPDTEGAWEFWSLFNFNCVFPLSMTELVVQARRQSATSFEIKGCSMTLLKKV